MKNKSLLTIIIERSVFIGICLTTIGTFLAACFTKWEPNQLENVFIGLFVGGFLTGFFYYSALTFYYESKSNPDDSISSFQKFQEAFYERNK